MRVFGRVAFVLVIGSALITSGAAEKPTLEHIFPAGASRNSTHTLTLFGKFDAWPPKVWSSCGVLVFNFPTNKGKVEIKVPADAPVGPCLFRLYSEEGASEPCIFVVDEGSECEENEPNNHFSKPQLITNLPVTINGRLEKNGDVDSYGFQIKAGQWLDAAVDSYTLMSTVDPVLRLVDTNGYQIAWNHDFATFDPRLIWQSPQDQMVVLQLFGFLYPANSEIQLSGGPGGVYRLHLALLDHRPVDVFPEITEHEPNNSKANAVTINVPGKVVGTICPANDEDRFRIELKKDQYIEARVEAGSFGSPLDAWLKIEDSAGKELARNDDVDSSRDPRLEWKAPNDGDYVVVVGSVTHEGNADFRYRLEINPLSPDYRATAGANAFIFTPGATNEIKFTLKRLRGLTNELSASVTGLPESITEAGQSSSAKEGENTLRFVVATNALPFSAPIQIVLRDSLSKQERPVPFQLVSRSENNGVPGGYTQLLVETLDQLWLTVKPKAEKK